MFARKIGKRLLDWKNKDNHLCLIVQGPRQVGKTFSIREFAKKNYENYIELNFVENPSFKQIFDGDLNVATILENISLYTSSGMKLIPHKTLLFLDEIQTCPNARTALKFLAQDKRFDVIASGSMLGISFQKVSSYPTGYVEYLDINPLDFEEFLWANGVDEGIIEKLKQSFDSLTPVNEAMNNKMIELLRQYLVIGGMPACVDSFVKDRNYTRVLLIQRNIVKDYENDIAKYAESSEKVKAKACFESIPSQLAREHKKFSYRLFDKNGRANKYLGSLEWLLDAGIIRICNCLSSLEAPLTAQIKEGFFKVYMADTGLLVSLLDDGTNAQIINGELGIYKGAIFENSIAQVLSSKGYRLFYFTRNNKIELSFVVSLKRTSIPIEVKAGSNRSKSIATILKENPSLKGIKLIDGNVGVKDNLISLPLYMAMFI